MRSHRGSSRGSSSPRGRVLHPMAPPPLSSQGWSPQRSHRGERQSPRASSAPPGRPHATEGFAGHQPRTMAPMNLRDQQRSSSALRSPGLERQFSLDALANRILTSRELGHAPRSHSDQQSSRSLAFGDGSVAGLEPSPVWRSRRVHPESSAASNTSCSLSRYADSSTAGNSDVIISSSSGSAVSRRCAGSPDRKFPGSSAEQLASNVPGFPPSLSPSLAPSRSTSPGQRPAHEGAGFSSGAATNQTQQLASRVFGSPRPSESSTAPSRHSPNPHLQIKAPGSASEQLSSSVLPAGEHSTPPMPAARPVRTGLNSFQGQNSSEVFGSPRHVLPESFERVRHGPIVSTMAVPLAPSSAAQHMRSTSIPFSPAVEAAAKAAACAGGLAPNRKGASTSTPAAPIGSAPSSSAAQLASSVLPASSYESLPPSPPPRAQSGPRSSVDMQRSSVLPAAERSPDVDRSAAADRTVGEVWYEQAPTHCATEPMGGCSTVGGAGPTTGGRSRRSTGRRQAAEEPTGRATCKPPSLSLRGASRVAFSSRGEVAALLELLESGPPSARRHPVTHQEVSGDGKEKGARARAVDNDQGPTPFLVMEWRSTMPTSHGNAQ